MRYEDFKKESIHHSTAIDALRNKAAHRDWIVDDGKLLLHVDVRMPCENDSLFSNDDIRRVSISTGQWRSEPEARVTVAGKVYSGGYFDMGHSYYDVGHLTPTQLRAVANAREIVDRWIAGEIDSLPDTLG